MVARIERAGVVNVAVVGLGWWGCHIIERFSTLTESPIRVHLAVEKIPDKSLNFVRRHKLEIMGDYERALDRSDIDAVILTTPHGQHEELEQGELSFCYPNEPKLETSSVDHSCP